MARTKSRRYATNNLNDLNHLRRGTVYAASTSRGPAIGEYLGIEVPHGERSIMLRDAGVTRSIAVRDVTSINAAA